MNKDDELAALKARIEQLEEQAKPKPEPKPFVPEPYQRYDPTAGMSMPMSTVLEMHNASGHVMGGVLHDNRAPTTPAMIPQSVSGVSRVDPGRSSTPGHVDPRPLRPPEGVNYADKLMDEQDRRDRAELAWRLGKG
jgi:hypothetical protein